MEVYVILPDSYMDRMESCGCYASCFQKLHSTHSKPPGNVVIVNKYLQGTICDNANCSKNCNAQNMSKDEVNCRQKIWRAYY